MQVRHGLRHLTNRSLGPNTIVQGALPEILANTPKSFFEETNDFIEVTGSIILFILMETFQNLSFTPA